MPRQDAAATFDPLARVTRHEGCFVIVGLHPQHLLSDHVQAARAAGLWLLEMDEGLIDEAWLQKKPKWEGYFGLPISFSMVWRQR